MLWSNTNLLRLFTLGSIAALPGAWSAYAQAPPMRVAEQVEPTPPTLADLRRESKANMLDLARTLDSSISQFVEQDLDRSQNYREVFEVRLRPGQAVQADLTSKAFDALLSLYDESGSLLVTDDDGAGGTNARLYFFGEVKRSTRFYLAVTANGTREGKFTLELRQRLFPRASEVETLIQGHPAPVEFRENSPLRLDDQKIYQVFAFTGQPGDRIKIETSATKVPLDLELTGAGQRLQTRYGEGGTNLSVLEELRSGGEYQIAVLADPRDVTAFNLTLTKLPPVRTAADRTTVRVGDSVSAEFGLDSPILSGSQRPYALFDLKGEKDQLISVQAEAATSSGQGRILQTELGVQTAIGFAAVRELSLPSGSVTSGGDAFRFVESGDVVLRVSAPPGFVGPYSLTVKKLEPTDIKPVQARAIRR